MLLKKRYSFGISCAVILAGLLSLSFAPADTYPRQLHIDIINYAFHLTLSDETDEIVGTTEIELEIRDKGPNTLFLDLIKASRDLENKGMSVKGVKVADKDATFIHEKDRLEIALGMEPEIGQRIKVEVSYQGIPATGLKIAPNKYGDRCFFSDNWPNKARNWLPTVDHPYDKATCEFIIRAPDHYQVISNGLLQEESVLTEKRKLTHWKQSVPIATWLYVLGVSEFAVQYVDEFEGKSIQTWVYKQDREAGFYDFAVPTKHCLEFFSDYVGPFAYEKLANIQSNSVGGGMEAATAIFYDDDAVTGTRTERWRNVIIHEVAHQWFGNAVTESDWNDVWLSEGFATYFTLLFIEHAYGREEFVKGLTSSRDRVFSFYQKNKDYRIVHENLSDMRKVTTGQTYQKGAWILHMLRNKLGDEDFQKGIQSYYTQYFNRNASTADFKRHMEAASGQSLDQFFQQWLYQGGNVVLDGSWSYDEKAKELLIELAQIQEDGFLFEIPVEIGIYTEGKEDMELVFVDLLEEKGSFRIPVQRKPQKLILDPQTSLLATSTLVEK